MTLVSDNIRFMRIFVGFPGERASNDSGVIENVDFQCFRTLYVFGTLKMRPILLYSTIYSRVALPLTPKYVTLNDLKWPFYVKLFLPRYV